MVAPTPLNPATSRAGALAAARDGHGSVRSPDHVTESFAAWFAGSKAVDAATGLPLTLYHGTPVFDNGMGTVTEFDRLWTVRNLRGRRPSIDNVGVWFSTNASDDGGAGMYAGPSGAIYPTYLSIANPHVTTFAELLRRMHHLNGDLREAQAPNPSSRGEVDNLRLWLRDSGWDGIKIVHDPLRQWASTEFLKQDAWIALEPSQIKSAIGCAACDTDGETWSQPERQRA